MAQTYIYAIHCPNKQQLKIGYASDPIKRLATLQCGTTDRLDLLFTFKGDIEDEKLLHQRLAGSRISGEWFVYNVHVLQELLTYQEEVSPTPIDFVPIDVETQGILNVAYSFNRLFTTADVKKALPSLNWSKEEIANLLLGNGYTLKTYPSNRVKYFKKP